MDDSENPDLEEPPRRVVSTTDPRRLYAVIVALLGVIVVLAIRPWGDGDEADRGADTRPSVPAAALMTPGPSVEGTIGPAPASATGLDETCGSPSGWRAATLQAWAGRTTPIRSWIAIEPVEASGPQDPAIPFAPVATGIVTALGYCAPLGDADRPPADATTALWALRGGSALSLTPLPLEPATPSALGGLWRLPPQVTADGAASPAPSGAPDVWPPGRYVIELTSPGRSYHRWLGVEIADLATIRASLAPAASPSAPSSPAGPAASGDASAAPSAATP